MRVQITADIEVKNMTEEQIKEHLPDIVEELFTFGYDPKVKVAVQNVAYPKE